MKRTLFAAVLFLVITVSARPDGTVTTPTNNPPTSWKIARIEMNDGAVATDVAGVLITIYYFDAGLNVVQTTQITLTSAELTSFLTTIESPVSGETGTPVKKYRQRVTSWLVANGKISNVTSE
jgi:hypothetical protein